MRFVVVKPNYRRRHGICRNMAAAGWPHWRIAQVLRIPRGRIAVILASNPLWGVDAARLRASWATQERRAA